MAENNKIDFVITWVDTQDEKWLASKNSFLSDDKKIDFSKARYRNWDTLKYWFRSVELYAPWVNKIYFVTCGQKPEWLNEKHPKLALVNHEEFIDHNNLPTFNSCSIEVNMNKIPGLSEQFVYFNDDMFLNKSVKPEDFFKNGKPCDSAVLTPVNPSKDVASCIYYNCMKVVNSHFDYKKYNKASLMKLKYGKYLLKNITLSNYPFNPGFRTSHLPCAYLKSTYNELWDKEAELLNNVSSHKFRSEDDVSQWLFQFWQLAKNICNLRKTSFGQYYSLGRDFERIIKEIKQHHYKTICINDSDLIEKFESKKEILLQEFNKRYPNKSSFEK